MLMASDEHIRLRDQLFDNFIRRFLHLPDDRVIDVGEVKPEFKGNAPKDAELFALGIRTDGHLMEAIYGIDYDMISKLGKSPLITNSPTRELWSYRSCQYTGNTRGE